MCVKVKKCSHNLGTQTGDLHKEDAGLSTHLLELPGMSTKLRLPLTKHSTPLSISHDLSNFW
jgi:hypothetical protein